MHSAMDDKESRTHFPHALEDSRLGQCHSSLESFRSATGNFRAETEKHYSLVVVTDTEHRRILLGKKHRGFGMGMFNSFGGKLEPGESETGSASRELEEETGIIVPNSVMETCRVGTLTFTFDDSTKAMIVHLYRVHVTLDPKYSKNLSSEAVAFTSEGRIPVNPAHIRGCDEITPQWFGNWYDIPLNNMFADDSVWLTTLLQEPSCTRFDGWFHFTPGGLDINTILHRVVVPRSQNELQSTPNKGNLSSVPSSDRTEPLTLEKRLFHALHEKGVNSPTIKEFKEAFAFTNATRKFFKHQNIRVVLDVAGGHGALGGLFLATKTAQLAVVIDPADVGGGSVQRAWSQFFSVSSLQYRHECLRTALPDAIRSFVAKQGIEPTSILVLGCHACQHLSDEIVQIACEHGTHVAVMPCCQRDRSPGQNWKSYCKNEGIPIEQVMDIVLAGKAMSWNVGQSTGITYDVRMRTIESSITPQNRLILCKAKTSSNTREGVDAAHERLSLVYKRAHQQSKTTCNPTLYDFYLSRRTELLVATASFALGFLFSQGKR